MSSENDIDGLVCILNNLRFLLLTLNLLIIETSALCVVNFPPRPYVLALNIHESYSV